MGNSVRSGPDAVTVVSFDLDGTLCQYHRSSAALLDLAFEAAGVDPYCSVNEYVALFEDLVVQVDDMPALRREAFTQLAREAGRAPAVGEAVAEAYTEMRDPTAVSWLPGMEGVFDHLADRYEIVVVTNGFPHQQTLKLECLGIEDRIETVVFGNERRKPDPRPFYTALEAVDAEPAAAVHIGDSLTSDVAGANNAGLASVWFSAEADHEVPASPVPDYVVHSPAELGTEPWVG